MYLKRLELQGFKSFPEKIRLEFTKGVTAVVGPNGSGKSNVSDAIRWVLGEQSAKSLRGAKMEDIIFAGTSNRKPLGFAEVSMVMDNSDQKINLEYSEITVTRRVYRSGESQFLINGNTCRLKDIHELFMDTGIGREGYSIIGQGRVEEILSTKSEDRRLLFEEAAGIVKFKTRKQEAQSKLEREQENLLRVNDIILELERQLQPLEEQSNKAKHFIALSERQKLVLVNLFLQEIAKADIELNNMETNLQNLQLQCNTANELMEQQKEDIECIKKEHVQLTQGQEEKQQEVNDMALLLEKKENDIRLCEQTIEHANADIQRLRKEMIAKTTSIKANEETKKTYEARHNAGLLELSAKNEVFLQEQREFDAINKTVQESETEIEHFSAGHIEKIQQISDVKAHTQRLTTMYEQLEERKEELGEQRQFNQSKTHEVHVKQMVLQKDDNTLTDNVARLMQEQEMLEMDKATLQENILEERANLEKTTIQLRELSSRHKLLVELEANFEGYQKSVRSVLKEKAKNPQRFAGIHGAVVELMHTEKTYEAAIEIAMGGALQNIITNTEEDAKKAIAYLKENNSGRATFLPLSAIKGRDLSISQRDSFLSEAGVVGVAKELLHYDKVYEPIFSNLLGRVVVIDTVDNAIAFAKRHRYEFKVVTLSGELFHVGGSLSGGSVPKGGASLLGRSREIADLKEKIDILTNKAKEISQQLQAHTERRQVIAQRLDQNKQLVQEAMLQKERLKAEISQTNQLLEEFRQKEKEMAEEEHGLMEQIVSLNKSLREQHNEQNTLEKEVADILQTMDKRQTDLAESRLEKDKKNKVLTSLQVGISETTQQLASLVENMERLTGEQLAMEQEIAHCREEIAQREKGQEAKRQEIKEYQGETMVILANQQILKEEIANVLQQKQQKTEKLHALEAQLDENTSLLSKLTSEHARLEVKKEQAEEAIRNLHDHMWDEYKITPQMALQFEKLPETLANLQKEDRELRGQIRELGHVNLAAIEEFQTTKERFIFLTNQRNDILEAEKKLQQIVAELEKLMEQQFATQFKVISENFGVVFAEMFGGGKAYLQLSDKSNILESGIDIIAQPPGKTLQNMSLFSGGERSFIAIALLFAILRMKPSPFCILDEIESALDDANVRRYGNYLQKLSSQTQFIVITHRKGTMESADVLYGVTMQEQGISKLVSVKLTEATEMV